MLSVSNSSGESILALGCESRIRYFAFNLLEELDQPGEWYLDRKQGILYFYPPDDPAKAEVEIGMLSVPMVTLNRVSHVRLEGLVFDLSRGSCMSLQDCEDCLIAGCTVKRFAGSGISIVGGHDDGILGCDLYSLGRGATEVIGGDRCDAGIGLFCSCAGLFSPATGLCSFPTDR